MLVLTRGIIKLYVNKEIFGSNQRNEGLKGFSQKAQWINKYVFHVDSVFKHKIQDNYPANKARIYVRADDFHFQIWPIYIYIYTHTSTSTKYLLTILLNYPIIIILIHISV